MDKNDRFQFLETSVDEDSSEEDLVNLKSLSKDSSFDEITGALKDKTYEEFCQDLKFLTGHGKKAQALFDTFKQGWKDTFNGIKVTKAALPILDIHPTQNVIFTNKSLAWNLSGKKDVSEFLSEESPTIQLGDPIVVCEVDGIKHIIDGHHRWSTAYAFNPKCKMVANVIKNAFRSADAALKFAQGTLAALNGEIKIKAKTEKDKNLYTIDVRDFAKVVNDNLAEEVLGKIMNEPTTKGVVLGPKTLVGYLWKNIIQMRDFAYTGDHERWFMPQFPQGDTNPANAVKNISESSLVTLTFGQLKRLVAEARRCGFQ